MTKAQARRVARARLEAISAEHHRRAAVRIETNLWSLPPLVRAASLLLFASLPTEVPTSGIAAEARRRGLQVVYPRCLPEGLLALHAVAEDGLLESGRYGIMEPGSACPAIEAAEIDVVLIPGLAWSGGGHRLGRGAGYYDRLLGLPELRAFRCGLFFEDQRFDALPVDDWDVRMHAVVTEEAVRFFES